MIIDAIHQKVNLTSEDIAKLAKRDTGVGFDQCLLIEPSPKPHIDFFYRIFNADGHEVGQCGNGARCLARFAYHYGLTPKKTIRVATATTDMQLQINQDDTVTVEMEKPRLNPEDIPLDAPHEEMVYAIPMKNGKTNEVHAVSVGNPHAIMVVSDSNTVNVASIGKEISEHRRFPLQTNVGFMQILQPNMIRLRVYERGCGETRACGSGAVAAVAVGRLFHKLAEHVTVQLPGGELTVTWPTVHSCIRLTGPATFVYEGQLM